MITARKPLLTTIAKIRITKPISEIAEIRIRAGREAALVDIRGETSYCSEPFSAGEIADVFAEICRYSVYSFQGEIAQGYVTLDGGNRVGICGTAVYKNGKIDFIKDISGLNIRIAHEKIGCANELFERFFRGEPRSLILGGKPLSGKTTLLRDLARRLSENHRVTIIDSRNELSGSVRGTPSFDVGRNTDVLCGAEKSDGIMLALRTMSPEVIICDEIADDEEAVERCAYCGVKLIAAAHAGSIAELKNRFSSTGILRFFDCAAVVKNRGEISETALGEEL